MKERSLYFDSWQIVGGLRHWVCFAFVLLGTVSGAETPSDEQYYDIDIPSLNAADALNRLAEQTGATVLFPYDLVRVRQANAVTGRYTLRDALERLLGDSGLSSGLSVKRVIQISLDETGLRKKKGKGSAPRDGACSGCPSPA